LRNEKDKFSVVNQSTAVYCFNKWVYYVVKRLGWPITQTHDDLMLRVEDTPEAIDNAMKQIKAAMEDVNEDLKLNVKLDCEVQTGHTFAETH
jgi:DNA polymerase I - 3''-5'' exonuclease and polymerase domains